MAARLGQLGCERRSGGLVHDDVIVQRRVDHFTHAAHIKNQHGDALHLRACMHGISDEFALSMHACMLTQACSQPVQERQQPPAGSTCCAGLHSPCCGRLAALSLRRKTAWGHEHGMQEGPHRGLSQDVGHVVDQGAEHQQRSLLRQDLQRVAPLHIRHDVHREPDQASTRFPQLSTLLGTQ